MDYYTVLNIKENASFEEIKKSFRKKLKEHHPDMHEFKKDASSAISIHKPHYQHSENLVSIIDAYTTLSNPIKRKQYDTQKERIYMSDDNFEYGSPIKRRKKKVFNYEKFLLSRQHVWEYKVKFFVYDLVFCRGDRAKTIYEQLKKENKILELKNRLGYLDYFDCMFLMAEYYHTHNSTENSNKAIILFTEIGNMERERPYFLSYMEEVADRVFELIQRNGIEKLKIESIHSLLNNMKDWPILKKQKKKIEKFLLV